MRQNVHFMTFATADLEAARRFYANALGWHPLADVPGEIIFFQVAPGVVLGLFDATNFNRDLGDGTDRATVSGVIISHNVDSPDAVRSIVDTMAAAGGTVLKEPQPGDFGGIFHAHVRDPNGLIWEIAHNPTWHIAEDGTVSLG
jgi:catechol 2,3-dioxygenase-like lactoylglutathione lyase family enzyme